MWPIASRPAVHEGCVVFAGPIGPPAEQVLALASREIEASRAETMPGIVTAWAVRLVDRAWGDALVAAPRTTGPVDADALQRAATRLTDSERAPLDAAEIPLLVRVTRPGLDPLAARKHLLYWLRLLLTSLGGLVAVDTGADIAWSLAMLDDELAHDADLDVESVMAVHCMFDERADGHPVRWLHTHGLEALGGVDLDVLRPSPFLAHESTEAIRVLAYASLDGAVTPRTRHFALGYPEGAVAFLPADVFQQRADPADAGWRVPAGHSGRRAVACEPRARGWLPPAAVPSRFLQQLDSGTILRFRARTIAIDAARAQATLDVFKGLADEFGPTGLPVGIKLACTTSDGRRREDVWFAVHRFDRDRVDATAAVEPLDVPGLARGLRAWHTTDTIRDWMVASPTGTITSRNLSAARRLRESGWPGGRFAAPAQK